MGAAREWGTTLFGYDWHIFDNEVHQFVTVFIIEIIKCFNLLSKQSFYKLICDMKREITL